MRNFGFFVSGVGLFFIFGGIYEWFTGWYDMRIALAFVGCAIAITGFVISAIAIKNRE